MLDLFEELRGLVRSLNTSGAGYALWGGLAVAVHGRVRATVDIDLLVPSEGLDDVKRVCRAAGFKKEAKRMNFLDGGVPVERLTLCLSLRAAGQRSREIDTEQQMAAGTGTKISNRNLDPRSPRQ